jgi:nicotinamidase-related amidase
VNDDAWPYPPIKVPIAPEHIALLVVDMQYHDASPEFGVGRTMTERAPALADYYFSRLEDVVIPSIRTLLDLFRRLSLPVVHLTFGADLATKADLPRTLRERNDQRIATTGRPSVYSRFDPESAFVPHVAPTPDELVLNKTTHSGFASTPLALKLRNMEVDTLVIAGVVTSVCVDTTARDAVDLGFRTAIVEDACCAWDQESHDMTLRSFSRHFGMVATVQQIQAALETREVPIAE